MQDRTVRSHFESAVLTHLDAAYNFARWITHDDAMAEDAVQDACVKAFRFFDAMTGSNPKAWFLAIVRTTAIDCLRARASRGHEDAFDEDLHGSTVGEHDPTHASPEQEAMRISAQRQVHAAIQGLPLEQREVVVLREFAEMSYKEISVVVDVPIGTVMSRLARGRDLLRVKLHSVYDEACQ